MDISFKDWAKDLIDKGEAAKVSKAWSFTLGSTTIGIEIDSSLIDRMNLGKYAQFTTDIKPKSTLRFFRFPFPQGFDISKHSDINMFFEDGSFFVSRWNVFGVCKGDKSYFGFLPYSVKGNSEEGLNFSAEDMMLDNSLRIAFAHYFKRDNQCFIHSSGIIRYGQGLVFIGKSGAGKSTVSSFSKDFSIVSDDLVVVSLREEMPILMGCPFFGEYRNAPQMQAPLKAIFSLIQSPVDEIIEGNFVKEVLTAIMTLSNNKDYNKYYFNWAMNLMEKVPVWGLRFTRSNRFWDVILEKYPELA
jgi:hypothetical protein